MTFNDLYKYLKENFDDLSDIDFDFTISVSDDALQNIFAMIWADWMEQEVPRDAEEYVNMSGQEITDIAPKYNQFLSKEEQRDLEDKVYGMLTKFEEANGNTDIKQLYKKALEIDGQNLDDYDERYSSPERFAWLVIMKMLGHGVSWEDDHKNPNFKYPYSEISYFEFPSFKEFEKEDDSDDEPEDWEFSGEEWKDNYDPKNAGEEWKKRNDDEI
jgi:hypothetical protein